MRFNAILPLAAVTSLALAGCDMPNLATALIDFNAQVARVAGDIDKGIAVADTTLLPAACVLASDVAAKIAIVQPVLDAKVKPYATRASNDLIALATSPDCKNIAAGGTPQITLASIVVTIRAITAQTGGLVTASSAVKTPS